MAALKRLEEYDKGLGMKHNHADDFISKLDANMSLFWGLAVMAYEQTLISDQTAYDTKSMSALAERGLDVFRDKGCADCHLEPEFAGATYSHLYGPLMEFEGDPVPDALNEETTNEFTLGIAKLQQWMYEGPVAGKLPPNELVELMPLERITLLQKMGAKPTMHVYDNGFYNIGVTNTSQDNGIGGYGKSGFRPSEWFDRKTNVFHTREDAFGLKKVIGNLLIGRWKTNENDPLELSLAKREHYKNAMVDGAFKTPTLRNIALTGPYFHNGSYSTLRGVLEFYNRQGDFPKNGDLHPDMRPPAEPGEAPDMAMSESDMDALIAFFNSLTDPRVKYRRAPFDHPSISIPVGLTATGDEDYYTLDAVGRDGGKPVPTWQQRATAN